VVVAVVVTVNQKADYRVKAEQAMEQVEMQQIILAQAVVVLLVQKQAEMVHLVSL
jgi:hypothetical protein